MPVPDECTYCDDEDTDLTSGAATMMVSGVLTAKAIEVEDENDDDTGSSNTPKLTKQFARARIVEVG